MSASAGGVPPIYAEYNEWFTAADSCVWETFRDTDICQKCNSICATIKNNIYKIPRWVSFSPDEMVILRKDLITFVDLPKIWKNRRELYRPKIRKLVDKFEVDPEAARKAWFDRSKQSSSNTEEYRKEMLALKRIAPKEFQDLCETLSNDLALGRMIRGFGWSNNTVNSFIYWYHKKHGDPGCRNNFLGIGPGQFVEWFKLIVIGDEDAAKQRIVSARRYR